MEQTMTNVATQTSFFEDLAIFMNEGGIFMWIILLIWVIGVIIAVERFKSFAFFDTKGDLLMNMIKKNVLLNDAGPVAGPMAEVNHNSLSHLTKSDRLAIATYLKTVTSVPALYGVDCRLTFLAPWCKYHHAPQVLSP